MAGAADAGVRRLCPPVSSRLEQPSVVGFIPAVGVADISRDGGNGDAMEDRGLPIMSGTKVSDPIGRPAGARKLIAVVHADMVGYSHLIGLDDVGTLDRLRMLRRTLIDPTIDEHGGRIVNTGGDSLLMVFDSVEGAVRCAVNVQQQIPAHDGDQPPDRLIRFRFGINLGDVIPDGTDVHGNVVNVAARLQAECPPGAICVSRAVRDHVQDRLNLTFKELGGLTLKNIARPIEAFVLRLNVGATTGGATEPRLAANRPRILPSREKPSIAVLPFDNLSGEPDQQYFADGLTEDILTALAHYPTNGNRSQFYLRLQGSCRQHHRSRAGLERSVSARRKRAPLRRSRACHRTVDRRGNISAPMG